MKRGWAPLSTGWAQLEMTHIWLAALLGQNSEWTHLTVQPSLLLPQSLIPSRGLPLVLVTGFLCCLVSGAPKSSHDHHQEQLLMC